MDPLAHCHGPNRENVIHRYVQYLLRRARYCRFEMWTRYFTAASELDVGPDQAQHFLQGIVVYTAACDSYRRLVLGVLDIYLFFLPIYNFRQCNVGLSE